MGSHITLLKIKLKSNDDQNFVLQEAECDIWPALVIIQSLVWVAIYDSKHAV